MNLLIAIAFVAGLAVNGIEETVSQPVLGEIIPNRAAAQAGLKSGDRILAVKGEPIENFDDLRLLISMNAGTPLKVVYVRDGVTRTTTLTPEREDTDFGPVGRAGFYPGFEPIVGRIAPGSPAAIAGLRAGDRFLAVNGKPVGDLLDYAKLAEAQKKNPIRVDIARGAQRLTLNIGPINPADEDRLGAGRGVGMKIKLIKLAPFPALRYSVEQNWRMLKVAMSALGRLVRAEGSVKELSGPINIARISGEAFRRSFPDFIGLLAMISLQLGIMNLLPIPVLDGGHIMILLIEGAARRDLSIRVKERIQQVGFAALATLMLVVLYNDVISNVLRMTRG